MIYIKKIIELNNIKKNYYTIDGEIKALENISIDILENEFLSIVGPSGCGKSTLLNIISGLDFETSGNIKYIDDKPIIGYMLQTDAMLPWLTVFENACLGQKILNIEDEITKKYTKTLLEKYGLTEFLNKYPKELSGGMKQRVP
ncbi:MAG: ATP-binding cassette domain-containing protein [bacterium]